MHEAGVKLAMASGVGLALAGLLGIGLANYAESGAFEFYKQPRITASGSEIATGGMSPTETSYSPAYPDHQPAPTSRIDALYPVAPPAGMDAQTPDWNSGQSPSAGRARTDDDVPQPRQDASWQSEQVPAGDAARDVTEGSEPPTHDEGTIGPAGQPAPSDGSGRE